MKKLFLILAAAAMLLSVAFAKTEEQPCLPFYAYPGEDPIVRAVADYTVENSSMYWDGDQASVAVPAPVILKTVMVDDAHVDVYGNFWCMKYVQEGSALVCISGGENPGIMHLERENQAWRVASVDEAGDGEDYAKDIVRFCGGDKELENAYFACHDVRQDPLKSIREQFIRAYVEANQLPVDAYQDPYWEPVPLFD